MDLLKKQNVVATLVNHLKKDERIEFIYDRDNNLRAIQKVKLSFFQESMEGKADTDIAPSGIGRISFQGSFWRARSDSLTPITKGQPVLVVGRYNITLLVLSAPPV